MREEEEVDMQQQHHGLAIGHEFMNLKNGIPFVFPRWMFLSLGVAILLAFSSLALLALAQQRQREEMAKNGIASPMKQMLFFGIRKKEGVQQQQGEKTENSIDEAQKKGEDGKQEQQQRKMQLPVRTSARELHLDMTQTAEENAKNDDRKREEEGNNR
jgi:lipopolysaccharide export LptBFGC system permease protein LptF